MNDKSLRSVIIVSSLNFALKSEDEKNAIISSYQNFLNSLSFPLQVVANSRNVDLSGYLKTIDEAASRQTSPLIKLQAQEYHNFLNELLEYSNIMEKRFYVVVPFYPGGMDELSSLPNPFKKKSNESAIPFEEQKKNLMQRVEIIINGLSSVGLRCVALGTEDLLELYYSAYNPDVSKNQKVSGATDLNVALTSGGNSPGESVR
jgi:hypothetical protein